VALRRSSELFVGRGAGGMGSGGDHATLLQNLLDIKIENDHTLCTAGAEKGRGGGYTSLLYQDLLQIYRVLNCNSPSDTTSE
jgi:hypothetical protein